MCFAEYVNLSPGLLISTCVYLPLNQSITSWPQLDPTRPNWGWKIRRIDDSRQHSCQAFSNWVQSIAVQTIRNNFRDQKTYGRCVAKLSSSSSFYVHGIATWLSINSHCKCELMDNQVAIPWKKMDHTDLKSYVTKLCLTISENTIII